MRQWTDGAIGRHGTPEPPDVLVMGQGFRLESAQEFFLARDMAHWGASVICVPKNWDILQDILEERFEKTLEHPSWWDAAWEQRVDDNRAWGVRHWDQVFARLISRDDTTRRRRHKKATNVPQTQAQPSLW